MIISEQQNFYRKAPISASTLKEGWTPPTLGWFKINFDVAIRNHATAQVVILRDDKANTIHARTWLEAPMEPIIAKAKAAIIAISEAANLGSKNVIFKGDALLVWNPRSDWDCIPNWVIESSILQGRRLLKSS